MALGVCPINLTTPTGISIHLAKLEKVGRKPCMVIAWVEEVFWGGTVTAQIEAKKAAKVLHPELPWAKSEKQQALHRRFFVC